jgi:hypothetical protein
MFTEIDIKEKVDITRHIHRTRQGWITVQDIRIDLYDTMFDSFMGDGWSIHGRHLYVCSGVEWNGSTGVPDTRACALASLVHDLIYAFLEYGYLQEKPGWCERRVYYYYANKLYYKICHYQGMLRLQAKIRYYGLKLLSPVYVTCRTIGRKIKKALHLCV